MVVCGGRWLIFLGERRLVVVKVVMWLAGALVDAVAPEPAVGFFICGGGGG